MPSEIFNFWTDNDTGFSAMQVTRAEKKAVEDGQKIEKLARGVHGHFVLNSKNEI